MKIKCSIVTKPIKDLATQIGKSEGFTNNLVSAWQTLNQSSEYPTADQLKGMLGDKENAWEVYLAIPNYEVRDYNPEVVPIEHVNGQVYLMRLPKENPIEHFYNMYKHLPELRDLVTTTEDAYRFILWREMAFMQYDLSKKAENRPVAEGEAIKKLKEWRKRHPQEEKLQEPAQPLANLSKEQQDQINRLFGPYFEGGGADINELFIQPAPDEVITSLETFNWENVTPLRSHIVWIAQNIKPEYKEFISSLYKENKEGQEGVNNSQGSEVNTQNNQGEVVREFGVPQEESTINVASQEEPAYELDPNNIPKIGIESVSIDRSNPISKASRDFTAMQRHDRVVMIAREFSNRVDALVDEAIEKTNAALMEESSKPEEEKDYNEIVRLMTKLSTYKDSVRGRHTVIQEAKPLTIFNSMRDEFESYLDISDEELDEDYGKGQGARIKDAYRRISENFDVLLDEATVLIEAAENLRIVTERHPYNTGNSTTEVTDATVTESSEDADKVEEATDDDEEGRRVDGNGGWSFKVRFVDPHSSLSKDVKKVLAGLTKLDINGEPEVDDLGYTRYINEEYAHAILINELSDMIDADDFSIKNEDGSYSLPALEKIADKYPWVTQIISALEAEPRLISSFYADFRKDFIPYWLQRFNENPKDGGQPRWETYQINKPVAIEATKSQITRDYEQGTQFDVDTIYAAGDVIRKDKAAIGITLVDQLQSMIAELSEEDYTDFTEKMAKALRMVGMNANSHIISTLLKTSEGMGDIDKVLDALKNIFTGVEEMAENAHLINTFNEEFNTIARLIGEVSELDNVSSFRQGDKTYYSYSAPNYLDTMFKTFLNNDRRQEYLDREFGRYAWFKDQNTGKWRNEWLRLIESDEQVRNHIALKELNTISRPNGRGVMENIEYSNWTPTEIKRAFIEEYFSAGYNPNSQKQYAWYNFPIFSDSPVTKFVRFVRYTGDFKSQIRPLLRNVVKQEMGRIKLVQDRKANNAREIANFDKNGEKFHFFPELNSLMIDGMPFMEAAMEAAKNKDADRLNNIIDEAISTIMEEGFSEFMSNNWSGYTTDEGNFGELAESLTQQGVITNKEKINEALEEYYWNSVYATTQIIELTTTDLAFYKDGTDFQKRYKEVYAAGTKLNTNSEYGRQVERTTYLADQTITSPSYVNIKKSLDGAVKKNHITSADRDSILYKFRDINVADAQAYRHPDSMRAILNMIGAWTSQMQESLDRFENGEWDMSDFNTIWQTVKPFVYSQIEKPDGLGGIMKVPHQNKNSEFLLLAMYSMVANSMNQSPKLKALNRFMRDNGIDVIQFESAVKAGKQGTIDINYSKPKLDIWLMNNSKEVKQLETALGKSITSVSSFKEANDILLDRGSISQEEYNKRFSEIEPSEQEVYDTLEEYTKNKNGNFNPEVVHEIPYKDYVIQQPTPEHLFDVDNAVFGSQFRNLVIADMPDDPNFRVKINGREFTKQEVLNLYQSAIVENLLDNFSTLQGRFSSIETLQKELMSQIKGNPKYGRDMVNALQLVEIDNPITGQKEKVFNIPLNNPSTTLKIQELVTSMFKNAVTKQKIRGGAAILVSDFGLTDELHLVHDTDGTLVGVECYLPAYSRKFYEPFMVERKLPNGNTYQELDIKKMPLELRKIIGYRIPTEDKYSMAPLIIKGFLPQQNGSSIMVSAEITQIAGSDFDVDKMFLMIPNFDTVERYDIKKAWDEFYIQHPELVATIEDSKKQNFERALKEELEKAGRSRDEFDEDQLNTLFENFISGHKNYEWVEGVQNEFSKWFKENKNNYYLRTDVEKVKYDIDAPVSSMTREQRDNMIIDIAYGILTNNDTSEKIHNPGNFDKAKKGARIASILSDKSMLSAWIDIHNFGNTEQLDFAKIGKSLLSSSLDTLDDFVKKYKKERSPLTLDTFIYNHKQNMTGGALIGMYANNTTMQAKYQVTGLAIKEENTFFINGRKISSLHDIMNENGERISKNCANFSAASVDNVKDPVLADLMQNTNTANIAGFMLRAGMSVEEISLLFSQPIIRDLITTTGSLATLDKVIKAKVRELSEMGGGVEEKINALNFTSEELISNALKWQYQNTLTDIELSDMLAANIQAAMLVSHIANMASELSELTQISRADSPNGAIAISIAKYKNQVQKVYLYHRKSKEKNFHLTGIQDILRNGLVNSSMSRDTMREKLLAHKMPMLQSFYSLGIEMAGQLISPYFSQTNAYTDYMLAHIYDNSPRGIVSDTVLEDFYSELTEFHLTKTKLLGDDGNMTFDQKRDYYLYDFPKEFNNVIANNPDIANISIIRKMQVSDGEIVLRRSGRLTPLMRETLMRDFDTMLYSDNPVEQKLAIDLFMYSFYKDGFKFGPNNFGTFFSSTFISSFPEFINTLRSMKYDLKQGTYFENFLGQFYANHWDEGLVPKIYNNPFAEPVAMETKDGKLIVKSKASFNRNTKRGSWSLIEFEGKLYRLESDSKEFGVYVEAPILSDNARRYNANMSIDEMVNVVTDQKRIDANKALNPSGSSQFDALEAMFAQFENMDMNFDDSVFAQLESEGMDYSEDAGQAQLDKPLCK